MAKTAKAKKTHTANPRSRAAKRAASPSIDVDKSLRDAPGVSGAVPALAVRPNSGVMKAKKKPKPMKRGQRERQEKGLARAEAVMDQLEKKVAGAQSRLKKRRDRRTIWEDVNETSKEEKRKAPKFSILADNMNQENEDEWLDEPEEDEEDTEMSVVDGVRIPASAAGTRLVVVDRTVSATASDVDEIT